MRILHLVGRSHRRGAEQVARELADELEGRGHANRMLAVSLGHQGERTPGVEPLVGHVGQRPAQLLRAVRGLRADLRRRPVDVVLAHGAAAAFVAGLALPAGARPRPKLVWQTTSALSRSSFGRVQRTCWQVALPHVDGAVALTAEIGEELHDFGYRGPVWTIPNARRIDRFVDLDRDREARALRTEIGVGPEVPVIGLVGYLVREKQPALAVEVLAAVRAEGVPAHLVVAGAGPLKPEVLDAVARTGLGEHVSLLGHRDDAERVLGGIDLLVLTSDFEGVPGILVEAAMAGCPVVTFPVGAVSAVVVDGETGVITAGSTVSAMASEVVALLADPDRRRTLSDAARIHGGHFAMEVVADRYEAHLTDLVSSSTAPGPPALERRAPGCDRRQNRWLPCRGARRRGTRVPEATASEAPGTGDRPRPKVLHITTSDSSLDLLLRPQLVAFQEAGYDVVTASAPGRYVASISAAGIRHIPLVHATRSMDVGRDLAMLPELYRLFRREQPDIVHTHNPKPGWFGRIAARLARVPVVMNTVHGLYATESDPRPKRFLIYILERVASAFSDLELVQNPEDVKILRKLGVPRSKLVTLGNGVDLERFTVADEERRARARADLGIEPHELVVGVVGRLVWEKGLREVFELARRLPARVPNVRLIVAGPLDPEKSDGLGGPDLEAIDAETGVEFIGERIDIEAVYDALDVYVLASHREGFPRSAMEAAASGLPVVASDIRGCRQVVAHGRTGLLFPVGKVAALTDAVVTLALDPERRREMGVAARRKAEAEFDQRTVITTILDAYRRLLARS